MGIPKIEGALKAAFARELKRQLPHFIVQRFASAGSPDRSITGNKITTAWEFKHGNPGFTTQGLQTLFCMRLAEQGHARYVLWQETAEGLNRRTLIVHPRVMHERVSHVVIPEVQCRNFDHKWLVEQVKIAHGLDTY